MATDSLEDNKVFQQTTLTMPVLAVGGEKSFGATEVAVMRNVATDVREGVISGVGHLAHGGEPSLNGCVNPRFPEVADFGDTGGPQA
jgi:hypothetical protein